MKKYLVAILACIAALFWFTQKSSNSSSHSNDTIKTAQPSTSSSSATLEKEVAHKKLKAPNNYYSCQQLITSEKETRWNWAKKQEWDQWLDKGYSIESPLFH